MTARLGRSVRSVFNSACIFSRERKTIVPGIGSYGFRRIGSNSTSQEDSHSKVYELRQYNIHPPQLKPFLELSVGGMRIRTQHSKMIGYWLTELGGINQVVHIWEYDNLAHRAKVRQNMASDPQWIATYASKILPMFASQENSILSLLPWSPLKSDVPAGGVYELQSFRYKEPDMSSWQPELSNYVSARGQYITPVGAFHTTHAGNRNSSVQLWHYPKLEGLESSQSECEKDPTVASSYSALLKKVSEEYVKILLPQPWSPLK